MAIPQVLPVTEKLLLDRQQCLAYAAYVRAARNALGLSQATLATMIGVTRSTLVRLEKGDPPLKTALCLAAVEVLQRLGVEAANLPLAGAGGGPLQWTIDPAKLWHTHEVLQTTDVHQVIMGVLLGADYVPVLARKPLRRKP